MSKECFNVLCGRIMDNVGEGVFKSELFLDSVARKKKSSLGIMYNAHEQSTGGFVSGDIKVALTLRLLDGGTSMDLDLIFEVFDGHARKIFMDVLDNWFLDDILVKINGSEYLDDEESMMDVARDFSIGSNGILSGCIGAVDGWVVKIIKPQKKRDMVSNAGSYYSRKGYYGLNVQVVVDKNKKVLYRSIISRGAEHDSPAFQKSNLHKKLLSKWRYFSQKGLYLIGDSAYALRSFLLTPFDNAVHGQPEDDYNFFHSSSRISVECTFGEVDLRWGILWKPLNLSLKNNIKVIDACLRMHNFIVDFRTRDKEITKMELLEKMVFNKEYLRYLQTEPKSCFVGVNGGEEEDFVKKK